MFTVWKETGPLVKKNYVFHKKRPVKIPSPRGSGRLERGGMGGGGGLVGTYKRRPSGFIRYTHSYAPLYAYVQGRSERTLCYKLVRSV